MIADNFTVLFHTIKKSNVDFYLFLSRVKDAEIVLKEKKQKKKFSEPDFLRS